MISQFFWCCCSEDCITFNARSLEGNRFTGQIPDVIGLMQALVILYVTETSPLDCEIRSMLNKPLESGLTLNDDINIYKGWCLMQRFEWELP